jgi:tetratricopeptide (TPR) repeat protein
MGERDTDSTLAGLMKELAHAPEVAIERPTAMAIGAHVDRYEILGVVGQGGMGTVYRARDTRLGRTVALKLLRENRSAALLERFAREARALAQLSHPNIVVIHDFGAYPDTGAGSEVGGARDEIFIAMELVEGSTVREWMREPHDWRAIVDVFVAVGRGLAAAHALGLVHRDVKPSNVFLDRDGTPKIGDFGLVVWAGALEDERTDPGASPSPHDRRTLTATGTVMGTPAYMAPEQLAGDRADARADQFAFCVSLFEALTGHLPGETREGRPMPRALEPVVARGMAPEPADRYPSIEALCAALARARRGNARTWAALAGAGAAIAIAGVAWTLARNSGADVDPCPAPTAAVDPVWGAARRAAVRGHALAIDPQDGAARASLLEERIDPWTRAWSDMRVEACRATRVLGEQSDTMLDRRMTCLDHRLGEIDDALGVVASATTPASLDSAIAALVKTSPLSDCADLAALGASAPPPTSPAERAKADAIAHEVAQIGALEHAGRMQDLLDRARRSAADARALGHAPTTAGALAELARVQMALDDNAGAVATLRELTQVAARAHDDRDEADAWIKLIGVTGFALGKPDEALTLVPAASAAVLRAGDPIGLRSNLLYSQGEILDGGPHPEQGLALLDQARVELEKAGAADPKHALAPFYADVLLESANAKMNTHDLDGAIADYHRSIDLDVALFGPDNADQAWGWFDLAETLRIAGRLDEAADAFQTSARIREERLGDSPNTASSLVGLASVRHDQTRYAEALELYDRALAMERKTVSPDDQQIVAPMLGRASSLVHAGRAAEARKAYDDIVAFYARIGARGTNLPITLVDRADLRLSSGDCAGAIADDEQAIALFTELHGKDDSRIAYALTNEGHCQVLGKDWNHAIATFERELAMRAEGGDKADRAYARFYLGRALVESGRDRAGGLAAARAARAALDGIDPEELAKIDRWLADHR